MYCWSSCLEFSFQSSSSETLAWVSKQREHLQEIKFIRKKKKRKTYVPSNFPHAELLTSNMKSLITSYLSYLMEKRLQPIQFFRTDTIYTISLEWIKLEMTHKQNKEMALAVCTHQEELAGRTVKLENPVISSFDCGHFRKLNNSCSALTV